MDHFLKFLSTLGPIGRNLPAPGTFGSFAGLFLFSFLIWFTSIPPIEIILFFFFLFILGIPLCSRAEILLKKADPPEVIWDEFTAIPLVFIFCLNEINPNTPNRTLFILTIGFVLFRIFDVAKPLGIRKLQSLPSGWGVMIDDFAAAMISACFTIML